jgi:hypothetical protein
LAQIWITGEIAEEHGVRAAGRFNPPTSNGSPERTRPRTTKTLSRGSKSNSRGSVLSVISRLP